MKAGKRRAWKGRQVETAKQQGLSEREEKREGESGKKGTTAEEIMTGCNDDTDREREKEGVYSREKSKQQEVNVNQIKSP